MKRAIWLIIAILFGGCSDGPETFQGYGEGEFLYLASARAGRLEGPPVRSGRAALKGERLFTLEAQLERAMVQQAQAELSAALKGLDDLRRGLRDPEIEGIRAQIAQARAAQANSAANLKRLTALYQTKSLAKSQLDAARAEAEADGARVRQLESQLAAALLPTGRDDQIAAQSAQASAAAAALSQASWHLAEKTITAPADGLIFDVFYHPGEWVPAASPVVRFLPPENVKVKFFLPQARLALVSHGQRVDLIIDGRAQAVEGTVTYLAPEAEFTPPVIYSNERREKLVFLAEARPLVPGLIKPGQPVTVRLKADGEVK